jgi:hypothetical protein
MIPELYRPLETDTLLDLVSYGDPDDAEAESEDRIVGEKEPAPRGNALGRGWRSWSSMRRKGGTWLRRGRRLIARSRSR